MTPAAVIQRGDSYHRLVHDEAWIDISYRIQKMREEVLRELLRGSSTPSQDTEKRAMYFAFSQVLLIPAKAQKAAADMRTAADKARLRAIG